MDDIDETIPPQRERISSGADDMTIPGKRDRKPDSRFAVGDLIMNRYQVLSELGQSGMCVVYKCFDETAGIEVALKALPPELSHNTLEMEDIKDNFQLVAKLVHQNIALSKNLEKDNANGNYYLIMECCEGEDLRRWIKRKRREGTLTLNDVLPIISQVADALDYAHEQKIIHRDIKPGNIIINSDGKIKVLDFGLAAQIHTSMTRVSMAYNGTSGTGPYMAPEQWRGRAQGAPADQYSLAVMTYEMLAGYPPFESPDTAVLREAVLKSKVVSLSNITKTANAAILRALSKDPAERFENCSDFAAALGGKKIKSAKKQSKGNFPKWAAAVIILALLGGGAAGYYFFDQQQKEQALQEQLIREKAEKERLAKLAAEKAERDRLAKLAEEKAERERLAKLAEEKRRTAEDAEKEKSAQENYRLQSRINIKKTAIDSANYDRGQHFGKYIDILTNDFASAKQAELNRNPVAANRFYKSADKAADWIIANAPLRSETQKMQKQIGVLKARADQFNASKLAYVIYKNALSQEKQGQKFYDSGNFSSAISALKRALSIYRTAYDDSRKLTVANFINAAKIAQTAKQWQTMLDNAAAALKIDSSNNEAQNLKQEAEKHLPPTLEVYAYVNGAIVKANVKALKTVPDRENRSWKLQKGSEYEFEVTHKSGKDEYYGKIPAFTCSANGPHRKKVILKKVVFNGTVTLSNGVKVEMVKVEPGTFIMSKRDGENYDDEVEHQKTLTKPFYIGKYEVTHEQWCAVMKVRTPPSGKSEGAKYPVESVSWREAMSFCEKMNQYAPPGWKFTLPTETQWEFAARGGNKSNGYKYSGSNKLNDVGWYDSNSESTTHEVGGKSPNELGIYDMSGNVREWCLDNWNGQSNNTSAEFRRSYNDRDGSNRVSRGGSWIDRAGICRSACRYYDGPDYRYNRLGFRLVLTPVQ